ncbi:MAG: FecR domain-containing protein [Bacteroidota bacterium]
MQKITPELLQKYFRGECSAEEQTKVDEYLENHQSKELFEETFQGVDKEALKKELWSQVNPEESYQKVRWLSFPRFRIAAVIVFLMGIGLIFYQKNQVNPSLQRNTEDLHQVFKAKYGEKRTIQLSEDTKVYLNAGSSLKLDADFGNEDRKAWLDGEGYFEVAGDIERPFIVQTGQTKVQVVGTQFNIRAYPEEDVIQVTVTEGKVRFSSDTGKSVMLIKEQQGVFSKQSQMMRKEQVTTHRFIAWKDDILVFEDQTLEEIGHVLERWYNVNVEIKKEALKIHRFTGRYERTSLSRLMKDMSQAMYFQYNIKDNYLSIY